MYIVVASVTMSNYYTIKSVGRKCRKNCNDSGASGGAAERDTESLRHGIHHDTGDSVAKITHIGGFSLDDCVDSVSCGI